MWSGRALCLVLTLHHARVLAIAELPEDTNFVFDGTSSNLAQHFYNLHKAGISAQPLTFTGGLPSGVLARLDNYSLVFEKLPPMLQRALVWDTGYVLGDSNKLVRVRVNCSLTMADIAVSADDYNDLKKRYNCTTIPCAPAMEVNRAYVCYQQPMTTKSRCAITTTSVANQFTSTMWAMGGDAKAVPNPYVINHLWNDSGYSHRMMSIHTVAAETPWKLCPSDVGNAASMVIPCAPLKDKDGDGGYCRPNPGKLVDSWLVQFSAQNKNSGGSGASGSTTSTTSKSTGLTSGELIGIIVAGVLFVAVIALVVVRRRRMVMAQKDESADAVTTPNQGAAALQPQYSGENSVSAERKFSNKQTTSTASSQVESTGNHSDLLALLKMIAGQVAPTFSSECPARIHNIAIACLDSQPEKRPSAREIVDALVTGKQPDYMRL
ncbi:TPA: hypothetical protein N0F65_006664 [Lagenidium giganteum]|uniref:TKL protein kinase n=1 Tax=Lagenidium giganteum TaxID=4803 RepID=A0AAV2YL90_9STRA|nr:TPA: hypothetical protein N0F65_006664 [Lagenidium giganteum]